MSYESGYGFDDDDDADIRGAAMPPPVGDGGGDRPRIVFTGLRRSGKSSIERVVFSKMAPHETHFLESSTRVVRHEIRTSPYIRFDVVDTPGQLDLTDATFDAESTFASCGAVVFVVDAQDDPSDAVSRLARTAQVARRVNPKASLEVFIHKVDGISDDRRADTHREIQQAVSEELEQLGVQAAVRYHLTSIYDHSVFEALSKVVQRLVPQLPSLERLLDVLIASSAIDKAFLFDAASKVYIATNSAAFDPAVFHLCSDTIDIVVDFTAVYGGTATGAAAADGEDEPTTAVVSLSGDRTLFYHQVSDHLALVGLISGGAADGAVSPDGKLTAAVEHNLSVFRKSVSAVFEATAAASSPAPATAATAAAAAARAQPAR